MRELALRYRTAQGRSWQSLLYNGLGPKPPRGHVRTRGFGTLVFIIGHAKITSMLAPQYTLRKLLAVVTIAGFGYLIVAAATRGRLWAVAALIAMLGLGLTVLLQAVLFGIARLLETVMAEPRRRWRRWVASGGRRSE